MITEIEKGQYVWFVVPQELSYYPIALGARVVEVRRGNVEVAWKYPHAVFSHTELYSTKRQARTAAREVLRQKIERMKSRTEEMERGLIRWEKIDEAMCTCEVCDVSDLSIHKPCIEKATVWSAIDAMTIGGGNHGS